jgi:hypothetical protein
MTERKKEDIMTLDKSYLGFTDKKAPMQKARIEAALDKLVRFENGVCAKKDFIFRLVLSGHKPKGELIGGQFSLRTYELLNPKMDYRMQMNGESCYYAANKTAYDFACYLFAQDLISEDAARRFIDAEQERLSHERQKLDAQVQRDMEEKQLARQAEKAFAVWLQEQAAAYSNQERIDLMKSIFMSLVGVPAPNAELLVLIENIDNSMCKQELISRLHSSNKASRKTFECLSGLNLPKTMKGTKAFISALSAADYKDAVPFKTRLSSSDVSEVGQQTEGAA